MASSTAMRDTVRGRLAGPVRRSLLASTTVGLLAQAVVFPAESVPGPEHRFLDALAGGWRVEGKWVGGDGKTEHKTGSSENRWILGGRFLQCDTSVQGTGGRAESRIVLGFDPRQQRYFALILDDQASHYLEASGTYRVSSRSFILSGRDRDESSGTVYSYRLLLRAEDRDRYVIELYLDNPGPSPFRFMEAVYTRSAEPAPEKAGASR